MAKESLFNILNNNVNFEELDVLDLFAGTGSISFEFVSRGCHEVMAVDQDHRCISFISRTVEEFKIDNLKAIRSDVFVFIRHPYKKYNLIFADPPYDLKTLKDIPDRIFEKDLLLPDGILIMEHPKGYDFKVHPKFWQHRNYGKVNFSFFKNDHSLTNGSV